MVQGHRSSRWKRSANGLEKVLISVQDVPEFSRRLFFVPRALVTGCRLALPALASVHSKMINIRGGRNLRKSNRDAEKGYGNALSSREKPRKSEKLLSPREK